MPSSLEEFLQHFVYDSLLVSLFLPEFHQLFIFNVSFTGDFVSNDIILFGSTGAAFLLSYSSHPKGMTVFPFPKDLLQQ